MKEYRLNKETNRIELCFSKEEYNQLKQDDKKSLKSNFIFSGKRSAWISKSTQNHYTAISIAKKLGFTEGESIGDRISFAEKIQNEIHKAESKIERYERYSENAAKRAEMKQAEFNSLRGDIAFCTQPNINSSSGRAFTNRRNQILERYRKGFEEYRKSEYFKNKAIMALETANMSKLEDIVYLDNRIKECKAKIRKYERNMTSAEEKGNQKYIERITDLMENEIDKLSFYENHLEMLGGYKYNKSNIEKGNIVMIRGRKVKINRVNQNTISGEYIEHPLTKMECKYVYAEIQQLVSK